MSERIDRAYQARAAAQLAAAGKGGGGGGNSAASTGAGRVLRLDGKTGKVKVQTKVVKPSTASSSNGHGKATVVEETTAVLDADDDDGFVPWIDVNDDGVREQLSVRSVDGETIAQRRRPEGRLFANVTLPEDEWPVWVPAASDESRLDDDDGDDLVNETGGEAGVRAVATDLGTNSDPRTASVPASNGAVTARAAVPGAAIPTEDGAKSKRRRGGKAAKGTKGKEGAGAAPP